MDENTRRALQELHLAFMDDLDPWEIMIDFLHQRKCFNTWHLSDFESITDKRKLRRHFLEIVKKKCTYDIFLEGLVYKGTHVHLANILKQKVADIKAQALTHIDKQDEDDTTHSGSSINACKRRQSGDTDVLSNHKVKIKRNDYIIETGCKGTMEHEDMTDISEGNSETNMILKNCCPLCKRPNRINIMDMKKKRVVRIQHHLKVLSHDGQTDKFESFLKEMFKRHKKDPDVKFALLDARVGRKKVSDTIVPEENVFHKMERVIPYTTNPLASSMLYLSRKGSAIAMQRPIEEGLEEINFAKSHSEFIQPCKDTGMVLYIEVNLLMKQFENNPSLELKDRIIKRISEAINIHFADEQPEIKEDYTRMLYLKMVFCYLGIGVDAGQIQNYTPSHVDVKNAESCLALIDRLPAMLDRRRRMFYHVARAVLFRYTGVLDLASDHVRSAVEKATEGQFGKELRSISCLANSVQEDIDMGREKMTRRSEELLNDLECDPLQSRVVPDTPSSDDEDI